VVHACRGLLRHKTVGRRRARIEERVLRRKPSEKASEQSPLWVNLHQSFRLLLGLALEAMLLALPSGSLGRLSIREARRDTPSAHASSRETEAHKELRVSLMFPMFPTCNEGCADRLHIKLGQQCLSLQPYSLGTPIFQSDHLRNVSFCHHVCRIL
jgi:hypothetical protein